MLSLDLLHPCPPVHCGHKGLFFDRLDVGVVAVGAGGAITEHERLAPGAELCGYARNRHYSPRHGRWLQMDPNATATALLTETAGSTIEPSILYSSFDLMQSYRDGSNLYEYVVSNAWDRRDPMGLEIGGALSWCTADSEPIHTNGWDPFDTVNEYIKEDSGSKAAFLRQVTDDAHAAVYITAYVGTFVKGPIGDLSFLVMSVIGEPAALAESSAWNVMNASVSTSSTLLFAKRLLGGSLLSFFSASAHYASTAAITWGCSYAAKQALRSSKLPSDFHSGPTNTSVYLRYEKGQPVESYAGETNNISRRQKQHGRDIVELYSGLTLKQAKAIETYIMTSDEHLNSNPGYAIDSRMQNRRRSISDRHPWFISAMAWAKQYIHSNPRQR